MSDYHGDHQEHGREPDTMTPEEAKSFRTWQQSQKKRRATQKAARQDAKAKRKAEDLTIVAVENVPKHVSKLFRSEAKALLARLIATHPKPARKEDA